MDITRPHISPYSMNMTRTFIFSLAYKRAPILFLFLDITRALFLPYSMNMTRTPFFFLKHRNDGTTYCPHFPGCFYFPFPFSRDMARAFVISLFHDNNEFPYLPLTHGYYHVPFSSYPVNITRSLDWSFW